MELETNLLTHFRLMSGIVRLKSPLELNFEGISEIKKTGEEEQDIHDFPLTTKFINMELTRSRAGTMDQRPPRSANKRNFTLENSALSLEKKKEELSNLFKEKARKESPRPKPLATSPEVSTPSTEKVPRGAPNGKKVSNLEDESKESYELPKKKEIKSTETESKDFPMGNLSQFDSDFLKTEDSVKVSFNYSGLQNFSKIKQMANNSNDQIFTRYSTQRE